MNLNQLSITKKKQKNIQEFNNLSITNNRSIIAKKDFIWLDVEFYDGEFFLSQKLSNYFAQLEERSYERIEKLNSYVNDLYKTLDFNFLFFNENLDIKQDDELDYLENLADEQEFSDIIDMYKSEFPEIEVEYIEEDIIEEFVDEDFLNNNLDEDNNIDLSNDEDDDIFQFFVPLALVSYKNGQKKSDFYIGNEFNQHLYFKKNIFAIQNELLIKKFLNKKYVFKIFNNSFFNKKFIKFNSLKSNFYKMINSSNVSFLKKKYYTNKSHRISKKYRKKKKKKLLMFKRLKLKSKISKNIILKNFKWFSNIYLLVLINLKSLHSYEKYSHINFLNNLYNFLSQMLSMKLKFFRRYRRRRRLKKEFFRNFEGKLGILNKQINDKEDDKKIKRKNRR